MISLAQLKLDKKTVLVFVLVPLCLSFIKYWGDFEFFLKLLDTMGLESLRGWLESRVSHGGDANLRRLIFWITILDFFYLVIPILFIRLVLKERLSEFGLSFRFERSSLKIYLIFLSIMFPLVYFFSGTESFQAKYPFYHISPSVPLWPSFWVWELFYFSQFFCLEFFFRGFMVHGLKNVLGYYSIFVMTIPYCMIHFGKPFPETISAILAGIILGFLSYRNKSIFLGFFLHISVALSMDLLALWRMGRW